MTQSEQHLNNLKKVQFIATHLGFTIFAAPTIDNKTSYISTTSVLHAQALATALNLKDINFNCIDDYSTGNHQNYAIGITNQYDGDMPILDVIAMLEEEIYE